MEQKLSNTSLNFTTSRYLLDNFKLQNIKVNVLIVSLASIKETKKLITTESQGY